MFDNFLALLAFVVSRLVWLCPKKQCNYSLKSGICATFFVIGVGSSDVFILHLRRSEKKTKQMKNLIEGLEIVKKYNQSARWECVDNLISCSVYISQKEDKDLMIQYGWFQNGSEYWSLGDSLINVS